MAEKRKPGRPPGPSTVKVTALLLDEQKERLDFLHDHLPGNPPVTGLVREAVAQYLDRVYSDEIQEAFKEERQKV